MIIYRDLSRLRKSINKLYINQYVIFARHGLLPLEYIKNNKFIFDIYITSLESYQLLRNKYINILLDIAFYKHFNLIESILYYLFNAIIDSNKGIIECKISICKCDVLISDKKLDVSLSLYIRYKILYFIFNRNDISIFDKSIKKHFSRYDKLSAIQIVDFKLIDNKLISIWKVRDIWLLNCCNNIQHNLFIYDISGIIYYCGVGYKDSRYI